jgi:hypothetical protein
LSGPSLDLIVPIRPLQLCADGGYQLRLGVLRVPLIMVPDNIVVKTRKASDLLTDLETTFKRLKEKGVKLNPEKCVFGVPRGMLLGFIVSKRGIEANP